MSLAADDVTVVIPARDAADTIHATITSLISQAGGSPRVIVVDDASTDATASIAAAAGFTVTPERGRGPAAARNRGLASVETELVAFCDTDDTWVPDRLVGDLVEFQSNPDLEVLLGRSRYVAADPELLEGQHFADGDDAALIPHFGAATMRTSVFDTVGLLDESLTSYEDYEWFYRARDLGAAVLTLDRVMQVRHLHADSMSHVSPAVRRDLLEVMHRSVVRRRRSGVGKTPTLSALRSRGVR